MTSQTVRPFDWSDLVLQVVHPLKVAIIEALQWIDRPIAPSELRFVFDEEFGLSYVAYHVTKLAEMGVLVEVEKRPVRGAMKTTYFFPERV